MLEEAKKDSISLNDVRKYGNNRILSDRYICNFLGMSREEYNNPTDRQYLMSDYIALQSLKSGQDIITLAMMGNN